MKPEFSPQSRALQRRFETERLADRVAENIFHKEFDDEDRAFIENARFFFLATVDGSGQPQCSYKGGPPGFVRITGPSELVFPIYEGNGFYLSAGNLAETGKVGLLFIDFEKQTRRRVTGVAEIVEDHSALAGVAAAQFGVRIAVTDIHRNCPRHVHRMTLDEPSRFTPTAPERNVGAAPWGENYGDALPDYMKRED